MPYLMHIHFDNSSRLKRRVYYFQYNRVRFKLIQNNPAKWSDVLMSLVPINDEAAEQRAYAAAGEFLSALAWQNNSWVAIEHAVGGRGVRDGFTLRQARCSMYEFPIEFC